MPQLQLYILMLGEGTLKHESLVKVYKETWEMLKNANIEDIVSNNRRITDEEIKDPKLLDVMIKGAGYFCDNIALNL